MRKIKIIRQLLIIIILFCSCRKEKNSIDKDITTNEEMPGWKLEYFKNTPVYELAKAVRNDDIKKINNILKNKEININFKDNHNGSTVLMYATVYSKSNAIKALLENGADPNLRDNKNNESALVFAVDNTHTYPAKQFNKCDTNIIELMLKFDGDVNTHIKSNVENKNYENYLLNIACTNGCLNVVKLLVDKGANINAYIDVEGNCAILDALDQENLDIVKYLIIEKNANIPKVLFTRPSENEKAPEEKVTVKSYLKEQDYKNDIQKQKLRSEILEYLKKTGQG